MSIMVRVLLWLFRSRTGTVFDAGSEYGYPAMHLSTRFVCVISEAFIYAIFITSLEVIHLNEQAGNMNAARRDRINLAPALKSMRSETAVRIRRIVRCEARVTRGWNPMRRAVPPDADEPLNARDTDGHEPRETYAGSHRAVYTRLSGFPRNAAWTNPVSACSA
jgi:hypothetical protein